MRRDHVGRGCAAGARRPVVTASLTVPRGAAAPVAANAADAPERCWPGAGARARARPRAPRAPRGSRRVQQNTHPSGVVHENGSGAARFRGAAYTPTAWCGAHGSTYDAVERAQRSSTMVMGRGGVWAAKQKPTWRARGGAGLFASQATVQCETAATRNSGARRFRRPRRRSGKRAHRQSLLIIENGTRRDSPESKKSDVAELWHKTPTFLENALSGCFFLLRMRGAHVVGFVVSHDVEKSCVSMERRWNALQKAVYRLR